MHRFLRYGHKVSASEFTRVSHTVSNIQEKSSLVVNPSNGYGQPWLSHSVTLRFPQG